MENDTYETDVNGWLRDQPSQWLVKGTTPYFSGFEINPAPRIPTMNEDGCISSQKLGVFELAMLVFRGCSKWLVKGARANNNYRLTLLKGRKLNHCY